MSSKTQFVIKTVEIAVSMAQLYEKINGMADVYAARGYQAGGAMAITQADLDNALPGVTLTQFTNAVGAIGAFIDFCDNKALPAADRKTSLDLLRTDI